MSVCSIDDCTRAATRTKRTVCETHYYRMRRTGTYDLRTRVEREATTPRPPREDCAIDGCDRIAQRRCNDLHVCHLHGNRWTRHSRFHKVREITPPRAQRETCTVEDCEAIDDGPHGLCKMHKTRERRHGDPLVFIPGPDRAVPRGEDHHGWTGDDASYRGVHQRVKAVRGPARTHKCVDCGGPARHWSYDHKDPDERMTGPAPHSIHIEHYEPRCPSCHKLFDLAHLRSLA